MGPEGKQPVWDRLPLLHPQSEMGRLSREGTRTAQPAVLRLDYLQWEREGVGRVELASVYRPSHDSSVL